MFFSPLTIPAVAPASFGRNPPAADGLEYVHNLADARLPRRVKLQKLSCSDLGACGVWNQYEFTLFLLSMFPMDHWKLFVMDGVVYESPDTMCLVSVGRQCGVPTRETMPPPNEIERQTDDPFAFLESPLLKPGASTFFTNPFPDQNQNEDDGTGTYGNDPDENDNGNDSFAGDMEEQDRSFEHMDMEDVLSEAEDPGNSNPQPRRDPTARRDVDQASASGESIRSVSPHGRHQQATDKTILQECLQDRPGKGDTEKTYPGDDWKGTS